MGQSFQFNLYQNSFENLNISTEVKSFSFHFVTFTCSLKIKVKTKFFPQNSNSLLHTVSAQSSMGLESPSRRGGSLTPALPLAAVLTARDLPRWVQCLPKKNNVFGKEDV